MVKIELDFEKARNFNTEKGYCLAKEVKNMAQKKKQKTSQKSPKTQVKNSQKEGKKERKKSLDEFEEEY
ncbi:MAG TPA: hypothetical protein VMW25_04155 [Clostridia bacterium]|nr:hypothetical protein [Clostridia bacterium]